LSIHY